MVKPTLKINTPTVYWADISPDKIMGYLRMSPRTVKKTPSLVTKEARKSIALVMATRLYSTIWKEETVCHFIQFKRFPTLVKIRRNNAQKNAVDACKMWDFPPLWTFPSASSHRAEWIITNYKVDKFLNK